MDSMPYACKWDINNHNNHKLYFINNLMFDSQLGLHMWFVFNDPSGSLWMLAASRFTSMRMQGSCGLGAALLSIQCHSAQNFLGSAAETSSKAVKPKMSWLPMVGGFGTSWTPMRLWSFLRSSGRHQTTWRARRSSTRRVLQTQGFQNPCVNTNPLQLLVST